MTEFVRGCASRVARLSCLSLASVVATWGATGCESQHSVDPIGAYYRYDFPAARDVLRPKAATRNDDIILNNLRLGLAAMADGEPRESERALGKSFELLSTAGLNADRTTAAVLLYDGVRVWKGEPFEQALAFYWSSALYATLGQWDNARAAAANALFRLTDFGRDMSQEKLARKAARDEEFLDTGYTAVDTDFALGFLMQAIGADRSGAGGSKEQFDAAVRIDPALQGTVEKLRSRDYDTLLLVDFGRGPQKVGTGPDNAIAEFRSRERRRGSLNIAFDGIQIEAAGPTCDVERMAQDHRWNNLEDVRRAKSALGTLLTYGGAIATGVGAYNDSGAAVGAGLGAIALGLLLKAAAAADTRHLEFTPACIYLVPLRLDRPGELRLEVGAASGPLILPNFRPGTTQAPRAVYLRLHGGDTFAPDWMSAIALQHGNDHTEVPAGDLPWILGGGDVGTPSRARLEAYQRGGQLLDWNERDLFRAYAAQGIALGAGMENREGVDPAPSWRHILEGGTGLFTPMADSLGYKRIMYSPSAAFQPLAP